MVAGPLITIVGETASGKSTAAFELAQRVSGEIICADSWTVYRDFNIGTAKPSESERASVKHHLLDIANPRDGFSAALYKGLANAAIEDVTARGKVPIFVGGTGLYVDSVLYDFGFLPSASEAVRNELNSLSINQLLTRIEALQLDTSGIDTRNKRRLIRLIETNGARPQRSPLRANTLVLGMRLPSKQLRERIIQRVDHMLEADLEHEVANLSARYGWDVEPMKGIGYAEWRDYFEGSQSLVLTRERIISDTLGLAKRQRTWFKRNQSIQWCDNPSQIVDLATTFLNKYT